jgi:regulation of enolase protein 1 (concanavalin A-like superfamily)
MKWTVGTLYDAGFFHQGLSALDAGGSHGWQGANHLAWNTECSGVEFDRPATAHQLAVGVVSSSANISPVRSGTLPTEVVSWQQHVDPRSLYRAQLAERVGALQALAVLGRPYGDNYFTLTADANSQGSLPGGSARFPVLMTVTADYPDSTTITNVFGSVAVPGWPGAAVGFNVAGLPFGASAAFDSVSLNSAGTNFLNIALSNNCPAGSYPLLIQGNAVFPNIRGGSSTLNSFAPLTLNVGGVSNFSLSVTPFSQSVVVGTNASFTVNVAAGNGFSGAVALSVTNLPPGVSASLGALPVSGSGTSTLTLNVSNTAPGGSYTLTLLGSSGGLTAGATLNLTVVSTALPPPWADQDIGSLSLGGSGAYLNGVFTAQGSGSDIWSVADQFNYIFQPQAGDFVITARVVSEQNTDPWVKAGVMVRETTNANSAYVAVYVTPTSSHGVAMQYRSATGASAADAGDISGPAVPYWVRVVRSGSSFTGYYSADGATWAQIGAASLTATMASNVTAGLAVCSHTTSALNTSTFDSVSLAVNAADSDGDGIPDWWMLRYFGHATGSVLDKTRAQDDYDGDGMSNWAEYLAGTDPTNPDSNFRIVSLTAQGSDEQVIWTSVGGINYVVQAGSALGQTNAFQDLSSVLQSADTGESTLSFVDPGGATNGPARFYRVRLGP